MNLKEYFEKQRIDPVLFAVQCGVSVTSIYRYMRGGRPHRKTAYRIERMTGGKVTVENLLSIREEIA